MTVGEARSALLTRIWLLAQSPLEPLSTNAFSEEIRTFVEACINPENMQINTAVARSILPQKYLEELDFSKMEAEDVEMDVSMAEANDTGSSISEPTNPQTMFVLPPLVPSKPSQSSMAEMYYNIQALPTSRLLALSNKVQTTEAYKESIVEGKLVVIFGRIEELKRSGKWSSKQLERFNGPVRRATHWQNLLSEAQHVRNGRVGQRRSKIAMQHMLADAVLEYFANKNAGVNTEPKPSEPVHMANCGPLINYHALNPLSKELVDHALPETTPFELNFKENATNSQGLVPISKFITPIEHLDGWKRVIFNSELESTPKNMERPKTDLKFKQRSDHDIRPPAPPSLKLLSARVGSAWHPSDDAKLVQLVKQFRNNWPLISEMLANSTEIVSNVERRTPWQAFERWVQLVQPDMKEFRGRHAEASRQYIDAVNKTSQSARKRQMPVPLTQETYLRGHKRLRWASMLEGIRKVKRKRETVAKPLVNSMVRQRADFGQQKTYTARELSQVKVNSDKKIAVQMAQNRVVRAKTGIDMQKTQNMNPQRPVPRPQSVDMAGGMPSIAGLPLPASVAAAARQQQLKAQQQQQQQHVRGMPGQQQPNGMQVPHIPGQMPIQMNQIAGNRAMAQKVAQNMPNMQQSMLNMQQGTPPQMHSDMPAMTQQNIKPNFQQNMAQQQQQQQQQQNMAQQQQQNLAQQQQQNLAQQSMQQSMLRRLSPQQQRALQAQKMQQANDARRVNRPRLPMSREQLQHLMNQISQNDPSLSTQEVQHLAMQHMRRYVQMRTAQAQAQAQAQSQAQASKPNFGSRNSSPNPGSASQSPVMPNASMSPAMPNASIPNSNSMDSMPKSPNSSQ